MKNGDTESTPRPPTRKNRKDFLILIPIAVYATVWSVISWYRIASLNATYYDLSVFFNRMWLTPHVHWNLLSFFAIFSNTGLEFILFPISYFGTPTFYVILQSIVIGGTAVPIYMISMAKLKSKLLSFLIASSFLIYFPMAGLNWFDVHFQAFLPIFFITAYFLYLRGNMKSSFILFFIAGIIRYPFFIFVALFAVEELVSAFYGNLKIKNKVVNWKSANFLFLSTLLTLSIAFLLIRISTSSLLVGLPSTGGTSSALGYTFQEGIMTFLFIFGPLLFVPLLSKRWVFFYVPFFYMIFFSTNAAYSFPHIFLLQYTSFIIPFVYLGLIDGFGVINKIQTLVRERKSRIKEDRKSLQPVRRRINIKLIMVIGIILLLVIFDISYEPYGPLNSSTQINFGLNEYLNSNLTEYNTLMKIVKFIPQNDPYVLTQNNMIEVYPRAFLPNNLTGEGLVAGFNGIGYNLTFQDIKDNQFPLVLNGKTYYVKVDYILADVESYWCYYHSEYPSLAQLIDEIYPTGLYGIVASCNGLVLLERNYTGPVMLYSPVHYKLPATQFSIYWHAIRSDNSILVVDANRSSVDGIASWFGPYTALQPGTYRVTFYLETTDISKNNSILLDVSKWPYELADMEINGSSFISVNKIQTFNLTFSTNMFFGGLEFRGIDAVWNGTLTFYGVKVEQLNYSSTG